MSIQYTAQWFVTVEELNMQEKCTYVFSPCFVHFTRIYFPLPFHSFFSVLSFVFSPSKCVSMRNIRYSLFVVKLPISKRPPTSFSVFHLKASFRSNFRKSNIFQFLKINIETTFSAEPWRGQQNASEADHIGVRIHHDYTEGISHCF